METLTLDLPTTRPRILIVGGGFGGLNAAKGLAGIDADVILVDRQNHHLFQPLLYQVATAALSPGEIASPIREILRRQENVNVVLGEIVGVDLSRRTVRFRRVELPYDYLILAAGATHSYFGNDQWEKDAPGLKSLDDALEIRRRILLAFEEAEWEADEAARQAKLTFVVIGGGPTGVELAGAIKEIAAKSIPRDFRHVDTTTARVILVQAADRLLPALPEALGRRAQRDLEKIGVEVRLDSLVTRIEADAVYLGEESLSAENTFWAAGVRGATFASKIGAAIDANGRIVVGQDCSIPRHPEAFVIGDLAHFVPSGSGTPLPGVAQVAIQMGRHVATLIRRELAAGRNPALRPPFVYHDQGSMATIGRNHAVANILGMNFTGFFAWLLWCFVHIMTLVSFRRRIAVFLAWSWSYFSHAKSNRLITGAARLNIKRPRGEVRWRNEAPGS